MKTKGSLRRIAPDIRRKIVEAAKDSDEDREKLAHNLRKIIGIGAPSLETTKRIISQVRNSENPIDKPWHLATLDDNRSIPTSAIPVLLKIKKAHKLSIREAKWAARLYPWFNSMENMTPDEKLEFTYYNAYNYALSEAISELAGVPFDSSKLDRELLGEISKAMPLPDSFYPPYKRKKGTIPTGNAEDVFKQFFKKDGAK